MENIQKRIPDCPVEMTLQLIGDKWKVLIIRDLLTDTGRSLKPILDSMSAWGEEYKSCLT